MIEYILFPLNNFLWIINDFLSVVAFVAAFIFATVVIVGGVGLMVLTGIAWIGDQIYFYFTKGKQHHD